VAGGEDGIINAGDRADEREAIGGDRPEPSPDLAHASVRQPRCHRPRRPEQLVNARDGRVWGVANLLVGRADSHPATRPGNQIPVTEARDDRPVAGFGRRLHVDELSADGLDRHVEAELCGTVPRPRPASDDDGIGPEAILASLHAGDGSVVDAKPLDRRVVNLEAEAPSRSPQCRLEPLAVHPGTTLVVQRLLGRRQRRDALDGSLQREPVDCLSAG